MPDSPDWAPYGHSIVGALDWCESAFPDAHDIQVNLTKRIRFFDGGMNQESILCPWCGQRIESDWWQQHMQFSSDTAFESRHFPTPCCLTATDLNELSYQWPCGFARFRIAVLNPGRSPTYEDLDNLRFIVGFKLRVLRSRIY